MSKLPYIFLIIVFIFTFYLVLPFELLAETYTGDLTVGITPTCLSGDNCSYASNDNTSNQWSSGVTKPSWVKWDLGSTTVINKIRLYGTSDQSTGLTKDFTLEGSTNDSTWTELWQETSPNEDEWNEWIDNDTTVGYRYFRLTITENYRGDNHVGVVEFELYNCTDCTTQGEDPVLTATTTDFTYHDTLLVSQILTFSIFLILGFIILK